MPNFFLPSPGDVFNAGASFVNSVENVVEATAGAAVQAAQQAFQAVGNSASDGQTTMNNSVGQAGTVTIQEGFVNASEFQQALAAQNNVNIALWRAIRGGSFLDNGGGGFGGGDNSLLLLLLLSGGLTGAGGASTLTSNPLLLLLLLGGDSGFGGGFGDGGIAPIGLFGLTTL